MSDLTHQTSCQWSRASTRSQADFQDSNKASPEGTEGESFARPSQRLLLSKYLIKRKAILLKAEVSWRHVKAGA
jgi:hypothetical protein